jgi:Zn ribbon nucleic-acid-binding protein
MSVQCPRCDSSDTAEVYAGKEDNVILWHVYHCNSCAFTWRDTEPAVTIDPKQRPSWARLKGVDLGSLRQVIPTETITGGEG